MYTKHHFDIMGMEETNINWKKIPPESQLATRTREWWQISHTATANLETTEGRIHQYGGVALCTIGQMATRVIDKGKDNRRLGRWAWTRYQGRGELQLRVVVVYRPNKPTGGPTTVHAQQRRELLPQKIETDPRELFWEDLQEDIKKWRQAGELIIIGGDFNEDTQQTSVVRRFKEWGMRNIFEGGERPPPTYNGGKNPIDGIFVSEAIRVGAKGMMGFGEGITSDHRCVWMDIHLDTIGVQKTADAVPARARRLQHRNPRTVKRYLQAWRDISNGASLPGRVQTLYNEVTTSGWSDSTMQQYEQIDQERIQGMLEAEKKCRKLSMGNVPWTPDLTVARARVQFWTLLQTRKKGRKVSSRLLARTRQKANLPTGQYTTEKIKEALKEAYEEYWTLKKQGHRRRDQWLQSIAEAMTEDGGEKSTHLKTLRIREAQRRTAAAIRRIRNKTSNTKIRQVTPKSGGAPVETRSVVEHLILQENESKIKQAWGTPFLTKVNTDLFGRMGETAAAGAILHGLIPTQVARHSSTYKLLRELQQKGPHQAPRAIDIKGYRQFWLRCREFTASGPSGLHFGHLKANARDEQLATMDVQMINIPMLTGYAPTRWRKATDSMLLKKEGVFQVDKLRTIVLFEADFNYMNKFIGRTVMQTAEKNGTLAEEQYGSRAGRKAIDQAINKRLYFDILRQHQINGAICSNDAASCYDRIVHSMSALAMRSQGISAPAMTAMFSTLQRMEHRVRTAHGISAQHYNSEKWVLPSHGVGQGNGAGPAIWAVVSTAIVESTRRCTEGTTLVSPISQTPTKFVGFSFVDDSDLTVANTAKRWSTGQLTAILQNAVTAWEEALRVTGGSLAPHKSYWTPITPKPTRDARSSDQYDTAGLRLWMRDKSGNKQEVEKLRMDEARTMLGVNLSADGNNRSQVQRMTDAAIQWQEAVRVGRLNRSDAWIGLRTTILKTLEYPLAATTLTKQECKSIMAKVLDVSLPAGGVWRHMPRAVVHGPIDQMGLGIPDLYVVQGSQHIRNWVSHCTAGTTTGRLLRHSLEAMSVEVGSGQDVWKTDFYTYGHLATQSLAKATWHFMTEGHIEMTHPVWIPHLRENDSFIIATAVRLGWKGKRLEHVNEVRKWMKVLTWAELTDLGGTTIRKSGFLGHDQPHLRRYDWPHTLAPTKRQWQEWRTFLHEAQQQRHTTKQYLGAWKIDLRTTPWKQFGNPAGTTLYVRNGQGLSEVYRSDGRQVRSPVGRLYHATGRKQAMPHKVVAVEASPEGALAIRCEGWMPFDTREASTPEYTGRRLTQATLLYAMTDGSFKDSHATAAWGVKERLSNRHYLFTGETISPGRPKDQSAYRSELAGILGLIQHADNILGGAGDSIVVLVGCDCLSAINVITGAWEPEVAQTPHGDLIYATRAAIKQSHIQWKFHHVRGHQDDKKGAEALTDWETMNVDMDGRAKRHWEKTYKSRQADGIDARWLPWQVHVGGEWVPHRIQSAVIRHWTTQNLHKYLETKRRLASNTGIWDENALRRAMTSLPNSRQVWMAKWTSGHYGHSQAMQRWGQRTTDRCPRCGKPEHSRHLLECAAESAKRIWKDELASLASWMTAQGTAPPVQQALLDGIAYWRSPLWSLAPDSSGSNPAASAVAEQDQIGWDGLFFGRLAAHWALVQHQYWERRQRRKSAKKWAATLSRRIWEIPWKLWMDRNDVLHRQDDARQRAIRSELVDAYIREAFLGEKDHLPQAERAMFKKGVQATLAQPLATKEAWVLSIRAAMG